MLRKSSSSLRAAAALALLLGLGGQAAAEVKNAFDLRSMPEHKVAAARETHLPIRLRPGKYQVVQLNAEFGHATVDDAPATVTVVPYGRDAAALYPHAEGATHVTIYGKTGAVLMARYVVVADPAKKYVRLHETCKDGTVPSCGRTLVYYCPNFCYESFVAGASATVAAGQPASPPQ